jgi:hypothetical protein
LRASPGRVITGGAPVAQEARVSAQLEARHVYRFGVGVTDGRSAMKDLLGGKGANLAEMAFAGLPVPPGFTITTGVCAHVAAGFSGGTAKGKTELSLPGWLWPEIDQAMVEIPSAPSSCRCAPAPPSRCPA